MAEISRFQIDSDDAVLLIVDVQEKLAAAMEERDKVVANCGHLIEIAKMKEIPIIVTEQYPQGLGPTIGDIDAVLPKHDRMEKVCFSCLAVPELRGKLMAMDRKKIILVGMETHICVLQTCLDLIGSDLDVHLVSDATCSRRKENWTVGVEIMRDTGAVITSTETVLFQLLKAARSEEFKVISKRIR